MSPSLAKRLLVLSSTLAGLSYALPKLDLTRKDAADTITADRSAFWRPQAHFSPPSEWLNDPNGLFIDSNGLWHMYYQYAPQVDGNPTKSWGHTTATDLLHWVDHPIAIPATDTVSIWSGSTVIDKHNVTGFFTDSTEDNVIAYYTAFTSAQEAQAVAYSTDGGYTFTNFGSNPIISRNRHNFRDPMVGFHIPTQKWIMTTQLGDGASVTFYSSTDFVDWTLLEVLDTQQEQYGEVECPQLIEMPVRDSNLNQQGSKWVLQLSLTSGSPIGNGVKYFVGNFNGTTFVPDNNDWTARDIDFGPDKYATAYYQFNDFNDANRNAISTSWATNGRYAGSTPTDSEGWRMCMNSPRTHWIDLNTNRLMSLPAANEQSLILPTNNPVVAQTGVSGFYQTSSYLTQNNPAVLFDLTVHVDPTQIGSGATATLQFQTSASNGTEYVSLQFNFSGGSAVTTSVTVTRSAYQSFNNPGSFSTAEPIAALPTGSGTTFTLHGLLDRSILEVYVNGGAAAGTLLYFATGVMDTVTLARGGAGANALLFDFEANALASVWT